MSKRTAGNVPAEGAPLHWAALNRERGLAVNADTSRCGWRGERIDCGLAIQALVQRRDLTAAPQSPG